MDSETIRITISPIFFLIGIGVIAGFVVGIFVTLLEQFLLVILIPAVIVTGIIILIKLPGIIKNRKAYGL